MVFVPQNTISKISRFLSKPDLSIVHEQFSILKFTLTHPMLDESPIRSPNQQIPTTRELVMVLFRRRRVFACVAGIVLIGAVIRAMTGVKYQSN